MSLLALLLVADIGLAGQWPEDWLEAATESRRRERPIVAAFGDVDPTFADGLASALSNDYVLVRVEKPVEEEIAIRSADPVVMRTAGVRLMVTNTCGSSGEWKNGSAFKTKSSVRPFTA